MAAHGSVTLLLRQLEEGNLSAVQPLWERYAQRLIRLARKKLGNLPRTDADEEDVALSVFGRFCDRAHKGLYPQLEDREDLWKVLVFLTRRRSIDHFRHVRTKRNDVGFDEASLADKQMWSSDPSPEHAAEVAERFSKLLGLLTEEQRRIALLKMEGYRVEEIASQVESVARTVKRKLRLIRRIWSEELSRE
jgi:DNA-directed RNA polymerase specialized sigma24 family protein